MRISNLLPHVAREPGVSYRVEVGLCLGRWAINGKRSAKFVHCHCKMRNRNMWCHGEQGKEWRAERDFQVVFEEGAEGKLLRPKVHFDGTGVAQIFTLRNKDVDGYTQAAERFGVASYREFSNPC